MKAFIFDFDTTIFFLFNKNYDRTDVIEKLNKALKKYGIDDIVDRNFFNSLKLAKDNKECLLEVDSIIKEAEMDALRKGEVIEGAIEFIKELSKKYKLAVVSNNAEEVFFKFKEEYLPNIDIPFFGRNPLHPEFLKPNPYNLDLALKHLNVNPNEAYYIGDNTIDYFAASTLNVPFIGMGSIESKYQGLVNLNKDFPIVRTYKELREVLKI